MSGQTMTTRNESMEKIKKKTDKKEEEDEEYKTFLSLKEKFEGSKK